MAIIKFDTFFASSSETSTAPTGWLQNLEHALFVALLPRSNNWPARPDSIAAFGRASQPVMPHKVSPLETNVTTNSRR